MSEPQYTDAQLSDGRTLRFIGQLGPDEIRQKVSAFRTREAGRNAIAANPPGIRRPADPVRQSEFWNQNPNDPRGPMPGVSEGLPLREALAGWTREGPGGIVGGAGDIAQGDIARGTHRMFSGAGTTLLPTLPFSAAAAPGMTARVLAGGTAGGYAGKRLGEAAGLSPDQADVTGDIGGLLGGGAAMRPRETLQTALQGLKTGAQMGDVATFGRLSGAGRALLEGARNLRDVWFPDRPVYPGAPLPAAPTETYPGAPFPRRPVWRQSQTEPTPAPISTAPQATLHEQLTPTRPGELERTAAALGVPATPLPARKLPTEFGFDWSIKTGPDIGQQVRAKMPSIPRSPAHPKLIEEMGGQPAETIGERGPSEAYYAGPGQVIGPKPGSVEDIAETKSLREQVREAAEREGRTILSQEKRDWFARNQPGTTKGELTGAPSRPVKFTKTPGVSSAASRASSGASKAPQVPVGTRVPGPEEDLTPLLKKSLKQAMRDKAQQEQ